jgi:hypothetical protein
MNEAISGERPSGLEIIGGAAPMELTSLQHVLQMSNIEPQDFPVFPVFCHVPSFCDLFPPLGNEDIYSVPLYLGCM